MRLEAQLSLAKRAEFDLAPLAPLQPPQAIALGRDRRGFVRALEPRAAAGAPVAEEPTTPRSAPRSDTPAQPRLSTQLRIELDALARRFVYRRLAPPDPEPVFQFPSEQQLAFSRALNAALRAAREAADSTPTLDLTV